MRKIVLPLFILVVVLVSIFSSYTTAKEIPPIDFTDRPLKLWVPYDPKKPEDIYNIKQDYIFIQSDDLKEIEDAKNPTKTKSDDPPINFQLSSATYYANVTGDYINISGVYNIEKLDNEWTLIPIISDQVGLASAMMDEKPAFMTTFKAEQDLSQFKNASNVAQGYYYLAIKNKGNHTLKTNFSVKLNKDPSINTKSFTFNLPKIPIVSLHCTVNQKDLDFQVPQATSISAKNTDNGSKVFASLPPTNYIDVKWNPKSTISETIEKKGPKLPPSITATSYNKIEVGRGSLIGTYKINIDIRHAAIDHFDFYVPKNIEIDSVNANDNIEIVDPSPTADKNGILPVDLISAVEGKIALTIKYRKNYDSASFKAEIPAITLANKNIERENGFVAVVEKTNIETSLMEPKKQQDYTEIDYTELPDILAGMKASVSFKYQKQKGNTTEFPYEAFIEVKRHEDIKVYEATITSTNINTVINEDGQIFTKAIFNVKNTRKQFLKITLPKGSEIWSVYVDNKSVKPAVTDENKNIYAIPLSKSIQENNNTKTFPVEIVYNNKSKFPFILKYLGIMNIKAISTELASNKVDWQIFYPKESILFPVELFSNVEEEQRSKKLRQQLLMRGSSLNKQFQTGTMLNTINESLSQVSPYEDGFQKHEEVESEPSIGLEKSDKSYAPKPEAPAQYDEYKSKLQNKILGGRGISYDQSALFKTKKVGKLPIRITLPDIGKDYKFSMTSFTENTNPNVFSFYINHKLLSYLALLTGILLLIIAIIQLKQGFFKSAKFLVPSILLFLMITYFYGWLILWIILLIGIFYFFKWALSLENPLKKRIIKWSIIILCLLLILFISIILGLFNICIIPLILLAIVGTVLFLLIKFIIERWPKKKMENKISEPEKPEHQGAEENMEGQNNE